MARFALLLTGIAILTLAPGRADAQERFTFVSWSAEILTADSLWGDREVEAADSVRQKVGYSHWKGAAIGGAAGAVAGLLLGLAARTTCSDCDPDIAKGILVSAGVVGAFGFLVGLGSPRYRWVPDTAPHTP